MQLLALDEIQGRCGSSSWNEIPFMLKEDLRKRSYPVPVGSRVLHWFASSGSTGAPVLYPWTDADEEVARATLCRIHPPRMFQGRGAAFVIAPTGLPAMWFHMDRQLRSLGFATVFPGLDPHYLFDLMGRLKPGLVISLPLVLSRLGEGRLNTPTSGDFRPHVLFCGGDVLSEARRARIERLWGTSLQNFYGLSEVFGPLANEAEGPGLLIWQAEEVFVEILDPATRLPVTEGQTGVAVITTLWDRPLSLVRYWTGDCFRLLGWSDPGRPRFQVRGREELRIPGLRSSVFPAELDDVLLGDPAAGAEWVFQLEGDHGQIVVEMQGEREALSEQTHERISLLFDCRVRIVTVPLGTLNRSRPKLGMADSSRS